MCECTGTSEPSLLVDESVLESRVMAQIPDRVAQLVTCLTAGTCLTADLGVESLIPARSYTFVEIDHEIISTANLLPSVDSRRVVVSYKQKYVNEVPVDLLVKLTQKKMWLGEMTVPT